jgi:SAM-dependent methyltransferase
MTTTFDPDAFRAFEREGHDRVAAGYQKSFTPITGLAVERLLGAASVGAGASVLDVATGPGPVAAAAAKRRARVVGIDLSPKMIELARRLHPGIEFRVADVEALPLPAGAFDAVICNFGLGHFPRPEAALEECVRVLAPGGRLAFAWWDVLTRQRLQAIFREAIAAAGAAPPARVPQGHDVYRFSDTAQFRNLLAGGGLEDVAVEDFTATLTVPDEAALWTIGLDSLVVTASTIVHAEPAMREAIRRAFDRIAGTYRRGGSLLIPLAYKIGSGRKSNQLRG